METLLDGAVRIITLRIATKNADFVPECLEQKQAHDASFSTLPSAYLKGKAQGEQILAPVEKVGCDPFLADIADAGYVMVNAFSQIQEGKFNQTYVLRFDFMDSEHACPSEMFQSKIRPEAELALLALLEQNMWRVKAYLNPYFEAGDVVDAEIVGQHVIVGVA